MPLLNFSKDRNITETIRDFNRDAPWWCFVIPGNTEAILAELYKLGCELLPTPENMIKWIPFVTVRSFVLSWPHDHREYEYNVTLSLVRHWTRLQMAEEGGAPLTFGVDSGGIPFVIVHEHHDFELWTVIRQSQGLYMDWLKRIDEERAKLDTLIMVLVDYATKIEATYDGWRYAFADTNKVIYISQANIAVTGDEINEEFPCVPAGLISAACTAQLDPEFIGYLRQIYQGDK